MAAGSATWSSSRCQRSKFGQGFEVGLALVLMAMILDRFTEACADRLRPPTALSSSARPVTVRGMSENLRTFTKAVYGFDHVLKLTPERDTPGSRPATAGTAPSSSVTCSAV